MVRTIFERRSGDRSRHMVRFRGGGRACQCRIGTRGLSAPEATAMSSWARGLCLHAGCARGLCLHTAWCGIGQKFRLRLRLRIRLILGGWRGRRRLGYDHTRHRVI